MNICIETEHKFDVILIGATFKASIIAAKVHCICSCICRENFHKNTKMDRDGDHIALGTISRTKTTENIADQYAKAIIYIIRSHSHYNTTLTF